MASLQDIRRRITSVEKTQKITRAMRMVAAAKLRRAQAAIQAARPYADRMRSTLEEVAASLGESGAEHPLLITREELRRVEIVLVTSDRGLCGAFNANVARHLQAIRAERGSVTELSYTLVGRKALEFARRRQLPISDSYVGIGNVAYAHAAQIAQPLMRRYAEGEVDEVVLVYNEFVSALTQIPRDVRLLPFAPEATADEERTPYEIEPDAEKLLGVLVPKAVEIEVYRALLENQAGEHGARMTAMESATRNTEDMIGSLTLTYNRVRQAAITKELVEIVSGAEAL